MTRLNCLVVALGCLALLVSSQAMAHPHAWITVWTTVLVNDRGEATGLREHWLFDAMYSAYAVQDFNPHKNDTLDEADLKDLARENVSNLKEFRYFTTVEDAEGKPVAFGDASDITGFFADDAPQGKDEADRVQTLSKDIQSRTKNYPPEAQGAIQTYVNALTNRRRIAMAFTVPFKAPQPLKDGKALVYRIYDPTYYTDMEHRRTKPVTIDRPGCAGVVSVPKVDSAMVFRAAAIDKNGTAPKDLGYYFSEKVTVSCPSPPS